MGRVKNRIKVECRYCGKEFEVCLSEVKKGGGKFCSRTCATTFRNKTDNPAWKEEVKNKISQNHADVSGKNNPMYNKRGKLSPSYIDGRNSFKGETYKKIYQAKGGVMKCKICGSEESLHIHHIDGNHQNNDFKNLTCLCSFCHLTIAHSYSRDKCGRFVSAETIKI